MTLRFNIFGYEVAKIELDMGDAEPPPITPVVKGVKAITKLWVKGMIR